jgi:hypothetical protein
MLTESFDEAPTPFSLFSPAPQRRSLFDGGIATAHTN